MPNKYRFIAFLLLSLGAIACRDASIKDQGSPIAKVNGAVLGRADLEENFGSAYSLLDLNVKAYIHNWVRNQVVLQAAKSELSAVEKDFSKELLDYENSLLRYTFESKILDDKTDTLVSKKEIEEYYEHNSKNFELKENFVKARILKVDSTVKRTAEIKKLFNYKDSITRALFKEELSKSNLFYVNYDSTWVKWEYLKELIPLKPYSDEYFLSNTNYREFWQDKELWLIKITDYQLKDQISPLEMVESKIRSILINRRKMSLIKEVEEGLYQKAVEKGQIKLYLKQDTESQHEN